MGRPKEFDPDEAVAQAMQVFRERGFTATSTDDLLKAMGIRRGSLYSTFGTKRKLFEAALLRYQQETFELEMAMLRDTDKPGEAIRKMVELRAEAHGKPGSEFGCLVVNTGIELGPVDDEFADQLRKLWKRFEDAIANAISRAQDCGEISSEHDARDLARFCITVFRGLGAGLRLRTTRASARSAARVALDLLS